MKVYWYELVYRGISPGAFPRKDFVANEHSHVNYKGKNFGAVAYSRPLTEKEIADYELVPTGSVRELHDFEIWSVNNK